MMSGHGANATFFNEKIKIGRPEHSLTLEPHAPNNISLLPYPPSSPLEVEVICVTPIQKKETRFEQVCTLVTRSISVFCLKPVVLYLKPCRIQSTFIKEFSNMFFLFLL